MRQLDLMKLIATCWAISVLLVLILSLLIKPRQSNLTIVEETNVTVLDGGSDDSSSI